MDEFILLVRSSYPDTRVPPPAHPRPPQQRWREWVAQLQAEGNLVALPPQVVATGRILTKGQPVADGPCVEGDSFITGLLLIKAADYEAATRIAQGCPALAVGGTIEVRRAL